MPLKFSSRPRSTPGVEALLALIALVLLGATFWCGSGFYYQRYNVPDLAYEYIPKFSFQGGSFGGFKLENRGRATAHKVTVNLGDIHTSIQQYEVQSSELWKEEDGGIATRTLVLSLERMASGSSLTILLLTDDQARLDQVDIPFEEGRAHLAPAPAASQLALLTPAFAGLILVALFVSILTATLGFRSLTTIRMRSLASESLLDLEDMALSKEREIQRLTRELDERQSIEKMPPPRAPS
jgi:hypothetical protein